MFCVGNSAPLLALFNLRIAMNRSQCLEDPVLTKAYGNCWCPPALPPPDSWKASPVPSCKVAVFTLNKIPACFWTTALLYERYHVSHQPSHFPHQRASVPFPAPESLFREAGIGALTPPPGPAETADHSCKQEHCPFPTPSHPLSLACGDGVCGTHEPQNLQPQPPAPKAVPRNINAPDRGCKCQQGCDVTGPRKAQDHQTPSATPSLQQHTQVCATGSRHGDVQGCSRTAWWEGTRGPQGLPTPQAAPQGEEGKDSVASEFKVLRVFNGAIHLVSYLQISLLAVTRVWHWWKFHTQISP